jgi:uncharacterized membrane protein
MKKSSIWSLLTLLTLALPALYLILRWGSVPARVPTHFGFDGQPDGYGGRETLWLLTALPLFIYGLLRAAPRVDPKRQLDARSRNYQKLTLGLVASTALLSGAILYGTIDGGQHIGRLVPAALCLMLAVLGNYLTTVQPNYFVGIRTPWTLESPVVWQRTHRFGGRLFVAAGLLGLLGCLLVPETAAPFVALGLLLLAAAAAVGYSAWASRQELRGAGAPQ